MVKRARGLAGAVVYMDPAWDTPRSFVGVGGVGGVEGAPNEGILSALMNPPRDLDIVKPLCELIRKFTGARPALARELIPVSVVGVSLGAPEVSSPSRYSCGRECVLSKPM
jgi:hypothetical protein